MSNPVPSPTTSSSDGNNVTGKIYKTRNNVKGKIYKTRGRKKQHRTLQTSAIGELIDKEEIKLLNEVMLNLRFETHKVKQAGRDYNGPFIYHNALRELFIHVLYYFLGQFSLIILIPWLGVPICEKKLFLSKGGPFGKWGVPYRTFFLTSFYGPVLVLYFIGKYYLNHSMKHVLWCDFLISSFSVFFSLGVVWIKYGMTDKRNYIKRNVKLTKKNRMSKVDASLTIDSDALMAPLMIMTGVIRLSHPEVMERNLKREFRYKCRFILNIEKDFFLLPIGLKNSAIDNLNKSSLTFPPDSTDNKTTTNSEAPSLQRKSVIQNPIYLSHNIDKSINESEVQYTKVKTLHVGDAIISSFVAKQYKEKYNIIRILLLVLDVWNVIFITLRIIALFYQLQEQESSLVEVTWIEWIVIILNISIGCRLLRLWFLHAALAYGEFKRRLYIEKRLATIIHQIYVTNYKDVEAWKNLRLAFREMGEPYYKAVQFYTLFTIFVCVLYNICLSFCILFDSNKRVPYYIQIVFCLPCLFAQGLVLSGVKKGSQANREGVGHTKEWLKIRTKLKNEIHCSKRNLKLRKKLQKEEEEERRSLAIQIEERKSAVSSIDNLFKGFNVELVYGGIRMFSMRLTKILYKSLFLLYLYEIYYICLWFFIRRDGPIFDTSEADSML